MNNTEWLEIFSEAWTKATKNGAGLKLRALKTPDSPAKKIKEKKKVKSLVDVFAQAESIGEVLELIWENPWSLLVIFNFW